MNITPRIKSARNHNNLIVNVSIEIPLKPKYPISHRSQETSISPSPNKHKKKYKLIITPNHQKKSIASSGLKTLRDIHYSQAQHPPSRKRHENTLNISNNNQINKNTLSKIGSCELSPSKKKSQTSRKSKEINKKVRNISILDQVINQDDNIIKYTSNSNQIRDRSEDLLFYKATSHKVQTHISEVDIAEIRKIQNQAKQNKERQYTIKINDILRIACAKKIQRAWRNYKTKKLIRSYSNDIRNKYLKNMIKGQQSLLSSRSQGIGLRFKKKLLSDVQISQIQIKQQENLLKIVGNLQETAPNKSSKLVKKIQEDSLQKWQNFLQQIKNKRNLTAALQFSLERSQQLKNQIDVQFYSKQSSESSKQDDNKIIKTKQYYQKQRSKWRQSIQRSNGSIKRQERVNYFENQMLRLENDDSYSNSSLSNNNTSNVESKQQQQLQNKKLRKKLQIFKNHLPEIQPFQIEVEKEKPTVVQTPSNRIDIASIIRKKHETFEKLQEKKQSEQQLETKGHLFTRVQSTELIEFCIEEDVIEHAENSSFEQLVGMQTYREWNLHIALQEKLQNNSWKKKLQATLNEQQQFINQVLLQEMILEALIEISESQKLISFIKSIYDKSKQKAKKPEGIVTNHSSIRDYLNYFISFLYEFQLEREIQKKLMKPTGPSPFDVLKYYRGQDILYDNENEYIMSVNVFNQHWEYANQLIYFDPKWPDQKQQLERIHYLKQLTKVFYRAIFDSFNESLDTQRIYGVKGKPYPWSIQRAKVNQPSLKQSFSFAFQRVIRNSILFVGVLFADKIHSLDQTSMDEILQQNLDKMLILQITQQEKLWYFHEDQLAQVKLELAAYIQQTLLKEMVNIIIFGVGIRKN